MARSVKSVKFDNMKVTFVNKEWQNKFLSDIMGLKICISNLAITDNAYSHLCNKFTIFNHHNCTIQYQLGNSSVKGDTNYNCIQF